MQFDQNFARSIAATVTEIERRTDAELVVVACARAGDYPDVPLAAGAIAALFALVLIVSLPRGVAPLDTLAILVACFAATAIAAARMPALLRLLVPRARQRRALQARVERELTRQQVTATPMRNGLLVLVARLEDAVVVVGDHGVENRIPRGQLQLAVASVRPWRDESEALVGALQRVGACLAEAWPKTVDDDDDLPDHVRIYA